MADQLKHFFDAALVGRLAGTLAKAQPGFPRARFVREASAGLDELELMARAGRIADVMATVLPTPYKRAIAVLVASLGPRLDSSEDNGLQPFFYLPHVLYVARHGLAEADFEASMRAQLELTQRFSAEFSIRAYLERHPARTLARLAEWAGHPDVHVRRLVSEGTRPRLPWAARLRAFQKDPTPILPLLERLKDDPELYVRRSVANNLNDIGKDHPARLNEIAARWLVDATPERRWVVEHALRSAIKRGDRTALAVLGFAGKPRLDASATFAPARVRRGAKVVATVTISNPTTRPQKAVVDLAVHFVKASGKSSAKVFKLRELELAPRASLTLDKSISFADLTTRKHYPGSHAVEVLINGAPTPVGAIDVQ
jgi:3-methyladenine DNA glycosylase AlkC